MPMSAISVIWICFFGNETFLFEKEIFQNELCGTVAVLLISDENWVMWLLQWRW